jgi:Mn2+/Fe2+ NRAMP family transporter
MFILDLTRPLIANGKNKIPLTIISVQRSALQNKNPTKIEKRKTKITILQTFYKVPCFVSLAVIEEKARLILSSVMRLVTFPAIALRTNNIFNSNKKNDLIARVIQVEIKWIIKIEAEYFFNHSCTQKPMKSFE